MDLTFFSVFDRGLNGVNQGGTEARLNSEVEFAHNFRGVANIDYLSSYVFRLAFSDVFTQAVNSEVRSQAFLSNTTGSFFNERDYHSLPGLSKHHARRRHHHSSCAWSRDLEGGPAAGKLAFARQL